MMKTPMQDIPPASSIDMESDIPRPKEKTKPYLTEMIHCHVCGGKASGLHYGVYSCEGCKGFFRRTQRLSLEYKPCPNAACDITIKSRNKCQYCRYQKCLDLGMSSKAVRMGRVPNAEKDKMIQDLAAAKVSSPDTPEEEEEDREHQEFVDRIVQAYRECYCQSTNAELEGFRKYCSTEFEVALPFPIPAFTESGTPSFSASQLEGPPKLLTKHFQITRHIACTFEMAIHKSARFVKKIEELQALEKSDLFALFKNASMELAMTFMAGRFSSDTMNFPEDNTYAECFSDVKKDALIRWRGCDFLEAKKRFFHSYQELQLTESEQAIFALLIMTAPDREEVKDRGPIETFQEKAVSALQTEISKNHPSDSSKIFPKTLSMLTVLRALIPLHKSSIHNIRDAMNGRLPVEPTPLLKEVFEL